MSLNQSKYTGQLVSGVKNSSQSLIEFQKHYPSCEFLHKLVEHFHIFWEIYEACNKKWHGTCGSYLFNGVTYDYDSSMYDKQKLLYESGKNSTNFLEVGVYLGHSLFILLLANPSLTAHLIDIDDTFSYPAIQILAKYFPKAKLHFYKGDSLEVLPKINHKFDLFHIDGLHVDEHVEQEWIYCTKYFMPKDVTIVFDDCDCCSNTLNKVANYSFQNFKPSRLIFTICSCRNATVNYTYHL
jgi:hypothetical protein